MRHGRMILILGDVHGEYGMLNTFISRNIRNNAMFRETAAVWKERGDDFQILILQCGDFAWFWPGDDSKGAIKNHIDWLPGGLVPIYWTGGNHEDWDALDRLGHGITEVDPGVFYCPFGSTLEISPDLTILFAGGAESADKKWRLAEMAKGAPKIFWEQEGISESDMERLEAVPKADWVISHTAPYAFDVRIYQLLCESSRAMLDRVFDRYRPRRWFFGHFHKHMKGIEDGCEWECLSDMRGHGKRWDKVWLEWED